MRWAEAPLRLSIASATVFVTFSAGEPQPVHASAFFIREQSAAANGSAFAGAAAGADDPTYMFFNSAALGRQSGNSAAIVGSSILSQARFRDGSARTFTGAPTGGGGGGNAGGLAFVPAMYGTWDLSQSFNWDQSLRFGLAVNAPFGFETEYQDDWIGRYYALQSRLRSIDFNPMIAWLPADGVSVAAGMQAQRIDAKLTNAVDFGSLGAANGVPGSVPGGQDGLGKLVGNDWGLGWTIGLLLEPRAGSRFGVGYRSQIHHEIEGDARLRLDEAGIGAALGQSAVTSAAKAKLTTPEVVTLGLHQQIDEDWAIMADATWTRWSRYRVLRVQLTDASLPDEITEEDWRDTWFFAGGTSVRLDEEWTLRCGIGWDQSPTRHSTRTPRTPANSGLLLAAGASWRPSPTINVAVALSHFIIESARIDLESGDTGNATRGDLSGSSRNAVDTLSVQVVWGF